MNEFERLVFRLRKHEKEHIESGNLAVSIPKWNEIKRLRKQIDDHLEGQMNLSFKFGDSNENKRQN